MQPNTQFNIYSTFWIHIQTVNSFLTKALLLKALLPKALLTTTVPNGPLVSFTIGKYSDYVTCDVILMHAGHFLLGRPCQYDMKVMYDGFRNMYNFVKNGKVVTLVLLILKQVYDDQM